MNTVTERQADNKLTISKQTLESVGVLDSNQKCLYLEVILYYLIESPKLFRI